MGRSSSYTMRDVARLARVSVTTVSSVLNGRGGVSPKLTQRVKEAVATMDYHPNVVARSLAVNRTFAIAVIVPDVSNIFFNSVIRGIETKLRQHDYSLILYDSHEDPGEEQALLKTVVSRRVDGILMSSTQSDAGDSSLVRLPCPIVCFDREPKDFKGGAVVIDNVLASYRATRHLIELGHKRIAVIAGPERILIASGRVQGILKALQDASIPLREGYLRCGDFSMEGGRRAGLELFRLPDPPTAVLACNNRMTLGLIWALKDLGVRCPQDVSVCGFDDFEWAELFSPSITTVVQPAYEEGVLAAEMLLQMIEAPDHQPEGGNARHVVLDAKLRVRESTAPPGGRAGRGQENSVHQFPKSLDLKVPKENPG